MGSFLLVASQPVYKNCTDIAKIKNFKYHFYLNTIPY